MRLSEDWMAVLLGFCVMAIVMAGVLAKVAW